MDLSKAAYSVIGLVIAVLIVATVAAPIISEAQSQSEPVTLYNDSEMYFRAADVGDVVVGQRVVTSSGYTDVWTLNGVVLPTDGMSRNWPVVIYSDGYYVKASNSSSDMGTFFPMDNRQGQVVLSTPTEGTYKITLTFGGESIDIVVAASGQSDKTYTHAYTWAYVPTNKDDGTYYASLVGNTTPIYANSANDLILCGSYQSGSNQGMYYAINGQLTTTYDGTSSISVESTAHPGVTGIIDISSIEVSMGDESFTPYELLAPYAVHGYATSGGNMSLLGVVALMLFVVPVMMAVRMISGRDE